VLAWALAGMQQRLRQREDAVRAVQHQPWYKLPRVPATVIQQIRQAPRCSIGRLSGVSIGPETILCSSQKRVSCSNHVVAGSRTKRRTVPSVSAPGPAILKSPFLSTPRIKTETLLGNLDTYNKVAVA